MVIKNFASLSSIAKQNVRRALDKRGKSVTSSGRIVSRGKSRSQNISQLSILAKSGGGSTRAKALAMLEKERRKSGLSTIDAVIRQAKLKERAQVRQTGPLFEVTDSQGNVSILNKEQLDAFQKIRGKQVARQLVTESVFRTIKLGNYGSYNLVQPGKIPRSTGLRGQVERIRDFGRNVVRDFKTVPSNVKKGYLNDVKSLKGKPKTQVFRAIGAGLAATPSSALRGFGKLVVLPRDNKKVPVILRDMFILKKKFKLAEKQRRSNQKITAFKKGDVQRFTRWLPTVKETRIKINRLKGDRDISNLRKVLILVGAGVVFGPVFGLLAAKTKLGAAALSAAAAGKIAIDFSKDAKKKGLISASTNTIVELGAIIAGSSISNALLRKAPFPSRNFKSKGFREIKKLPRQQQNVLRRVFNKGFNRLKKLKGKQFKQLKKEVIIKKKISGLEKKLFKTTSFSTRKKLVSQIKGLKGKLGKAISKRERLALDRLLKKPKVQAISKRAARKKIVMLRREIKSLSGKFKKSKTNFIRKRISKRIINKELEKNSLLKLVGKKRLPSQSKFRKFLRKDALKKIKAAELKQAKLLRKEKALKELAIRRVITAKGRQPKALRIQPIQSGRHKGKFPFFDSRLKKTIFFNSRKTWRRAVVKQNKNAINDLKGIQKSLNKIRSGLLARRAKKPSLRIPGKSSKVMVLKNQNIPKETKGIKVIRNKAEFFIEKTTKAGTKQQLVLLQKQKVVLKKGIKAFDKKLVGKQKSLTKQLTVQKSKLLSGLSQVSTSKLLELQKAVTILAAYRIVISLLASSVSSAQIKLSKLEEVSITGQVQEQAAVQEQATIKALAQVLEPRSLSIVRNVFQSVAIAGASLALGRFLPFVPGLGREPRKRFPLFPSQRGIKAADKNFVFIPDLASRLFGIRATPKQRRRLLRVGKVFSGLEDRPIV